MKVLRISKEVSLPLDVVTQTIAILAKRRAGKSYTMRKLVEELLANEQQVVLVDPKGDQWGIRSSADGKKPGYPIVILGGEHGDVPLEVSGGEVVAKLVVEERVSVLLDLSMFRKHELATFMTAFLENLYRLKAQEIYRTPVMLVIDEADAIAPQKPQKGEERMLGAAEDIVRRGGQRGIGCALITQRSAVLNKNVLTQAQMLVVLRTIAPQDLAAMKAWVDVHGTLEEGKTLMSSLPSLPIGDAWFWSPGWPTEEGIFLRSHVLPIETFDSGATPKPGQKKVVPKNLADVDLGALKKQMSATIEKAKNDDPRLLRKRIAELERGPKGDVPMGVSEWLAHGKKYGYDAYFKRPSTEIKKIEVPAIGKRSLERLTKIERSMRRILGNMKTVRVNSNTEFSIIEKHFENFTAEIQKLEGKDTSKIKQELRPEKPVVEPHISRSESLVNRNIQEESTGEMGKGEKVVLIAIAQQDGMTREHITVQTGYKRSTRDTYLQRLQARGYVRAGLGKIFATVEGIQALGADFEPLPTGSALQEHVLRRLPEGERKILAELVAIHPESLSRESLSEKTGYQRSTRDTYIQRLSSRQLVVAVGPGEVKASEHLFD